MAKPKSSEEHSLHYHTLLKVPSVIRQYLPSLQQHFHNWPYRIQHSFNEHKGLVTASLCNTSLHRILQASCMVNNQTPVLVESGKNVKTSIHSGKKVRREIATVCMWIKEPSFYF